MNAVFPKRSIFHASFLPLILAILANEAGAQFREKKPDLLHYDEDGTWRVIDRANQYHGFATYEMLLEAAGYPDQPIKAQKRNPFFYSDDAWEEIDKTIEAVLYSNSNKNQFASTRYLLKETGYDEFVGRAKSRYGKYRKIGHQALVNSFKSNPQAPLSPSISLGEYYVDRLTAPFELSRQRQRRTNNPAQYHLNPIASVTNPFSIPEYEDYGYDEQLDNELPLASDSSEQPSQLPILNPPSYAQNSQAPDAPASEIPAQEISAAAPPPAPIAPVVPIVPAAQPSKNEIALRQNAFSPKDPTVDHPAPRSPLQQIYDRGLQAMEQRNYTEARATLETLLNQSPDSPFPLFSHGILLFYSGDYEKSLREIKTSCELAQSQNTPVFALWQTPLRETDFQYHYKKLVRRVEHYPDDAIAKELLFLLSQAGFYSSMR